MIYIIDYDKDGAKKAFDLIKRFTDEVKIGKNEIEIIGSEKIVLPDTFSPEKALKKLHLFNLYSALRIYNKPILGIGTGFALMCQKFNEHIALGFFNCKATENNSGYEIINLQSNNKIITEKLSVNKYWGISSSAEEEILKVIREFVKL